MTAPDCTKELSAPLRCEASDSHVPARDILVRDFRQIFHWPLALYQPDTDLSKLKTWQPPHPWIEQPDPCAERLRDKYEEAVYFHDFVQSFLYFDDQGLKRWVRNDIATLHAHGDSFGFTFDICFEVEFLELTLFRRTGVAVIALGLKAAQPVSLAEAQTAIDLMRRVFPGFWTAGNEAGLVPDLVRVKTADGKEESWRPQPQDIARQHFEADHVPLLLPWWRMIASGLRLRGDAPPGPIWRHVVDERLPVMSYLSLDCTDMTEQQAIRRIRPGDWHRIASADSAGSDAFPYNPDFLDRLTPPIFYDRFMPNGEQGSAARQTYTGYHHAIIGAGWFFDNILIKHFQNHYRQMNLIAQMEFAAMLTFSRRLTDLVAAGEQDHDPHAFRRKLLDIRRDFLTFIHRYHFTDVSNHLQAREMNDRLRAAMGLDRLRAEVEAEIGAASDFALALDQADATRAQSRLSVVATIFLPATLAVGFGGMNIIAPVGSEVPMAEVVDLSRGLLWAGLSYLAAVLVLWFFGRSRRPIREEQSPTEGRLLMATGGLSAVFLGGAVIALAVAKGILGG